MIKVILSDVRVDYVSLKQPRVLPEYPNSPPKYGVRCIMEKESVSFSKLMEAVSKVAIKEKGEHSVNFLTSLHNDPTKRGWGWGAEVQDSVTFATPPHLVDKAFCSAKNTSPIVVFDPDGNYIIPKDNPLAYTKALDDIYSGCFCNVFVDVYHARNGVWIGLEAIQFLANGEPIEGSAPTPTQIGESAKAYFSKVEEKSTVAPVAPVAPMGNQQPPPVAPMGNQQPPPVAPMGNQQPPPVAPTGNQQPPPVAPTGNQQPPPVAPMGNQQPPPVAPTGIKPPY